MLSRWQGGLAAAAVTVVACVTQANRASSALSKALAGSGERDAALDEFRTYTTMLLAAAPVLIDGRTSRNFLEQAQHLDGEMALALTVLTRQTDQVGRSETRLAEAIRELKAASAPLLRDLAPEMRAAIGGDRPVS